MPSTDRRYCSDRVERFIPLAVLYNMSHTRLKTGSRALGIDAV